MSYPINLDDALIHNPAPRCPCMLLLDTSSSMTGSPITELNRGVRQFIEEVQSDEVAASSVELGVITFGAKVELQSKLTTVEDIEGVSELQAYGMTPMGEAVNLAISELESRKAEYQRNGVSYYQPWVVMMTDGGPNDEWSGAAQRLRNLAEQKKMVVLCVGIGDDAEMQILQQFSVLPPKKLNGLKFREFFAWLSQSMQRVSASTPGDKISLPSTGTWDSIDI
ncbi:vWA domain-containing protein [Photobacterium sp. J15]|uniref:vWA domain-containing protein n=1 Tax=Photobacterium sp. J15 TaxID=265901 RepID=UPI0007E38BF7|nr:VWA domain-containing protein [Photobacterium sp. J15]